MKIKIYKTTNCPYCKMEAEYLQSKGVAYEEIYVDKDPNAVQEMLAESGQMGVPFTVITKEDGFKATVFGFDKAKLDAIVGL